MVIKSGNKKVAIKDGDKIISNKMKMHHKQVREFMNAGVEYKSADFCELLNLKRSRVQLILNSLAEEGKIEILGGKRDRRYKLTEQ